MRKYFIYFVTYFFLFSSMTVYGQAPETPETPRPTNPSDKMVSLDFDNVDLPVLVKFISELTGKNFVIDEQVRGKVTIFSPVKIPTSKAYEVFISVLEMKGFTVIQTGAVYQILPYAASPPSRSTHIYTLQNTLAEEVAQTLTALVSRSATPMRPKSKPSDEITGTVQIITDKTTNRLIMTASDEDYLIIEKLLKSLDIKRRQVYVEAIVMEMKEDKNREVGHDFGVLGGGNPGQDLSILGSFNSAANGLFALATSLGAATATSTLGFKIAPVNVRSILNLLDENSGVNILSTPQILTSDRQKAEISVAQNVPFPGATTNVAGGSQTTTIERKDVGIIFRLTPTIMDSNQVKMDLYQEISSVLGSDKDLGPTTAKRSANTTVTVRDGQTAVIGGLLGDKVTVTERKIPLLGDIPILGYLFKTKTKKVDKTNLIILVTPHIVPDDGDTMFQNMLNKRVQESLNFMKDSKLIEGKDKTKAFLNGLVNVPEGSTPRRE
ncbi:MAG: secretin N-terminal domain-containing protein [Nitrospirota bacterium]